MSTAIVVHTTPPLNPLPASDADSIRLLGTLRLGGVSPGITTADWSANGKPFVTLDNVAIQERYLSSVPGWSDPDHALSTEQQADAVEWKAFIEGMVTDLVNHTMYSLPPNHPYLAGAQLAACPFPLNHYVPQRLRSINKARLQRVGIWGLGGAYDGDGEEAERKRLEDSIVVAPGGTKTDRAWSGWRSGKETAERQRKFGEEALRQRARAAFDPLVRKIGQNRYFYGAKPTTLDIALFSQLTLVLSVSWPNPLLAELLRSTYPTLVAHHDRVLKKLYPAGWASVTRLAQPPEPTFVESLRSNLPTWLGGTASDEAKPAENASDDPREKETKRRLRRGRYMWFIGAGLTFVSYILLSGLIEIQLGDDGEGEWEEGWLEEEDGDPFAGLVYDDDDDIE